MEVASSFYKHQYFLFRSDSSLGVCWTEIRLARTLELPAWVINTCATDMTLRGHRRTPRPRHRRLVLGSAWPSRDSSAAQPQMGGRLSRDPPGVAAFQAGVWLGRSGWVIHSPRDITPGTQNNCNARPPTVGEPDPDFAWGLRQVEKYSWVRGTRLRFGDLSGLASCRASTKTP